MYGRVRELLALFSEGTRRRIVVSVAGSLVLAIAEIVGLVAILPLMQLLTEVPMSQSEALRVLARLAGTSDRNDLVMVSAGLVFAAFVLKGIATVLFRWWMLGFVYRQEAETSETLLRYYVSAPYRLHLQRNSADLIRTMNDATSIVVSYVVIDGVSALSEAATIVVVLGTLLVIMPLPTIGVAVYFGVAGWLFARVLRSRATAYGQQMLDGSLAIYQTAMQALGGVKEIKIRHNADHFLGHYNRARTAYADARRRSSYISELPKYFMEVLFIVGVALIAVVTFRHTPSEKALTMLSLFVAGGFRVLPSIVRLLASLNGMRVGLSSMDLVVADITAAEEHAHHADDAVPTDVLPLRRELRLDGVGFRYADDAPEVVRGIDLALPAGSSTALVGSSGAGKSTLVDLVLGLHRPTSGAITVDGTDIAGRLEGWQRGIGMVPQDVYLLDDTLRANIVFGEDADRLDADRLAEAVERSQLGELLASLPEGLDTFVGERGVRLSGGQRQRIGIARALYLRPQVLVLDEATSALDNETERRITRTIESLHGEMTILVVAHRLSTVRHCDRVVFLSQGRVEASGSFEEVQEASPAFAHLVALGDLGSGDLASDAVRA